MKVLVTGAAGMLGQQVVSLLSVDHEVVATDVVNTDQKMDITDPDDVFSVFSKHSPDAVVHCAAMTDVDGCSVDPESAYKLNSIGTWTVACASAKHNAIMCHVSTDYVFDGEKTEPYTEFDPVNPVSVYGKSKLAAEQSVMQLLNRFFIVRTSWLFAPYAKNFPLSILKASETRDELKVVSDQVGSPTYAKDLAEFIADILTSELYGVYHFTQSGTCSWYEFAKYIIEQAGKTDTKVTPISSEEWPTPTKRPNYSVLGHYRMQLLGRDKARSWQETVVEFIKEWTTAKQ